MTLRTLIGYLRLLLVAAVTLAVLALPIILIAVALSYRSVYYASLRPVAFNGGLAVATCLALASAIYLWRAKPSSHPRGAAIATLLLSLLALPAFARTELGYRATRQSVFDAPRADLAAIGRHVIAGYRDPMELKRLVAAGAVGGVFVTARNVGTKTVAKLAADIAEFQTIARENGHPPLIITSDQEGGMVSRLSPPLARPKALAKVIQGSKGEDDRAKAVRDAAEAAGRDLAKLGVTLNFAPVVDVDFGIRNPADRHSRIGQRAISKDPAAVALAAIAYCEGLRASGVMCTLKHFPGLGRVKADTHVGKASLATPVSELDQIDWLPFRETLAASSAAVMVGHVTLAALDTRPASASRAVVHGILRDKWRFNGLVVTDDLTMVASATHDGGIGASAVSALAAGVDLLLVSFDTDQIYTVIDALLRARAAGTLNAGELATSTQRIAQRLQDKQPLKVDEAPLP